MAFVYPEVEEDVGDRSTIEDVDRCREANSRRGFERVDTESPTPDGTKNVEVTDCAMSVGTAAKLSRK